MKTNAEFEISLSDVWLLIKRRWTLITIIILTFVVLCCGYKIFTNNTAPLQQNDNYSQEKEFYDSFQESQQLVSDSLKIEWQRINTELMENPVLSLNPHNCTYERIVLRFSVDDTNHNLSVENWICKADDTKLFGSKKKLLSNYKYGIIAVEKGEQSTQPTNETAVDVFSVEGFDAKKGAEYLINHFSNCAAEEKMLLEGCSLAEKEGYSEILYRYQKDCRDEITSIYGALEKTKNSTSFINEPRQPQDGELKEIIKYAILGLILGTVMGIGLIIIIAIRKDAVISVRQIENAFNIELLSDCSSGSKAAVDVLNANIDILTRDDSSIMIIVDDSFEGIKEMVSSWSEGGGRDFIVCTDIFDDPTMIEALQDIDGVVLGIKIGTSKLEQLQRNILRVEKLNQNLIGYVLL